MEKVVLRQIKDHMFDKGLSQIFQSAYKANHSTETALLKVSSDILDMIDNREICLLVMLDLTAAFDTIDHEILLNRLEKSFLMSGTVLSWFESYLKSRYFCVKVRNETSNNLPLKYGVPQGSVLGPVIFTLYTKPLSALIETHGMKYHLYAHDTQLYKASTTDNIQHLLDNTTQCVENISTWMTTNKLKLNEDKTEAIVFGCNKNTSSFTDITLSVNGHSISCSTKVKNLGVLLNQNMSMSSFVSELCKLLYFQLRKISHVRKFLSRAVTKTLVTSFVLSRLDYCNSLLAGLPNDIIQPLQNVQNHAARIITLKRKRDHVTPLLKELHWLPVKERICYKICLLCYKCLNNMAPEYLSNFLKIYVPSRTLRSADDKTTLVKPSKNYVTFGQRSFNYVAPNEWNKLPKNIREARSIDSFKKQLKHHLFTTYYQIQ